MIQVSKRRIAPLVGRMLLLFALAAMSVYILVPLLWMLSTSLRSPTRSFSLPPAIFPTEFDPSNYRLVFQRVPFLLFIVNSLKVTVLATALQVCCSCLAAFAFSRLRFPGRGVIFIVFLSALMIPAQVTNIPRFLVMSRMGLIDTHAALILPAIFSPIGIFLIRQYMLTIPKSYDEAAYMDGASRVWCFARIIVPMAKPAMMVIAVQSYVSVWNDFYNPLIYLNSLNKMTLPLGLTALKGLLNTGNESATIAGVMLSLAMPLVLYVFGQRYLVEGVSMSGLKA